MIKTYAGLSDAAIGPTNADTDVASNAHKKYTPRTKASLWLYLAVLMGSLGCGQTVSEAPIAPAKPAPADHPTAKNPPEPDPMPYRILQDRPDRLLAELPNRMIVLAAQVHAAPVVSAQVWIKTGSIYEQEHIGAGLSHFLEHLIAGGTTANRTEAQTNAILSTIGAQTNAATSLDTVRYYINTSSAYTDQAVDLLCDWMLNSQITQQEYERERSVIQREFEMGQGEPGRILWKLTQHARYQAHPARHPTIGYLDEFLSITRNEIYDFYKRMYVPNNMVFVVVGDIDKQAVVEQIAQAWQGQKPAPLPQVTFPIEPQSEDGPSESSGVADIDKPQLRLAWPGTRLAGPGDYALDLLGTILGQGESSRLTRTVRDEQRLVNTIQSYNASFPWGEGFFGIDAEVATAKLEVNKDGDNDDDAHHNAIQAAKAAILEQVARIRTDGVSDEELARAKRKALAAVSYSGQSAQALATRLATDLIGMKDPDYLQRYAQAIQAVTAQEVQDAAVQFLQPSRLIDIKLLPTPTGDKPQSLARPADPPQAEHYERQAVNLDNAEILDHLRKQIDPASAQTPSMRVEPIQRHVLPNGLRVLVCRSTIVPAVAIQMYHLGGLLADKTGQEGLANTVATMRIKGTTTRTANQIARQIEDLGASLSTHGGFNTTYSRAVCLKEDWATALDLLADVTLNPTFPDDEWAKLQPRLLAAVDRLTDTWTGELRQEFRQAFFGDHPWSRSPVGRQEVIGSLTPDDMRAFYHQHLDASQTVLAVFGDIDPDAVVSRVQQLFEAMPSNPGKHTFHPAVPLNPASGLLQIKTSKPLAAVQIGFGPTVDRTGDDYPAIEVLSAVLSRFPSGWLEQELRGRGPGLVYAVGAGQFTGLVPGYFAVLFNTQPDTVTEALRRAMGVVRRVRDTRVDDETLAAAKAKVLTETFLYKQTNANRAADAAINELYGLGLDEPNNFRQQVQQLSAEQLQAVAQKYLRQPTTVVLNFQPQPTDELEQAIAPSTQPATQP